MLRRSVDEAGGGDAVRDRGYKEANALNRYDGTDAS